MELNIEPLQVDGDVDQKTLSCAILNEPHTTTTIIFRERLLKRVSSVKEYKKL